MITVRFFQRFRTRPRWRRSVAAVLALGAALATGSARADGAPPAARLACQPEAAPGRVLCELEVEVVGGRLAWADLLVVHAPEFAPPLRSRVGPRQALSRTERSMRLPIALVATRSGDGQVTVLARAVNCVRRRGTETCVPWEAKASAAVHVGPITEGPE